MRLDDGLSAAGAARTRRAPFRSVEPRPRWRLRRRWIVVYALLVVLSQIVQHTMGPADPEPGARTVTLPATDDEGPLAVERMELAYREWGPGTSVLPSEAADIAADAADEADESDATDAVPIESATAAKAGVPVILLHGAPGDSENFESLAPLLARGAGDGDGEGPPRRVIAPDLPGSGGSTEDVAGYSIRAQAHAVFELMDALAIQRAHVIGWSNGGGVALHMHEEDATRLASLTMLASIGTQENEGSGNYYFEHGKYAVGLALVGYLPEVIPHFGLLGTLDSRAGWLRSFWQTDQRPLEAIMRRVTTPTLILHGRGDILVPVRAARQHHALIRGSRLVVLDANHFLPFLQSEETAAVLRPFLARHDAEGVPPLGGVADLSPQDPRANVTKVAMSIEDRLQRVPWWIEVGAIAAVLLVSPALSVAIVGVLIVGAGLDWGVGAAGLAAGLIAQSAGLTLGGAIAGPGFRTLPVLGSRLPAVSTEDWKRRMARSPFRTGFVGQFARPLRASSAYAAGLAHAGWRAGALFMIGRAVAVLLWVLVSLIAVIAVGAALGESVREELGLLGVGIGLVLMFIAAEAGPSLVTRRGRQHLSARLARTLHHEYWPAWLFYLPLLPTLLWLAARHGGLLTPTCANPTIEAGGGIAGESKHRILAGFRDDRVLRAWLVPGAAAATIDEREALVAAIIREHGLELPVILKPDRGERGHAVKLIREMPQVREYLTAMRGDAVVQVYHPGPEEVGILWTRKTPEETRGTENDRLTGRIRVIVRKEFPVIDGDGKRTLEELIDAHPRFRRQSSVFLSRFADVASLVPAAGERIRLAMSGNHCQGTLFRDGADLITPELERAIDEISTTFDRLDVGRFDVRYESDEALRRGEGFAIVELNGISGEPTNMYDPQRSYVWAFGVLKAHWVRLFELGAVRRREGVKPLTLREVRALTRAHFASLSGDSVAD